MFASEHVWMFFKVENFWKKRNNHGYNYLSKLTLIDTIFYPFQFQCIPYTSNISHPHPTNVRHSYIFANGEKTGHMLSKTTSAFASDMTSKTCLICSETRKIYFVLKSSVKRNHEILKKKFIEFHQDKNFHIIFNFKQPLAWYFSYKWKCYNRISYTLDLQWFSKNNILVFRDCTVRHEPP